MIKYEKNGKNKIVVTRCHVFTTPMGISAIGQSPKTVDSAWLSLIGWKSCEQRNRHYMTFELSERSIGTSPRNLMRMIPRYRCQLEGAVSRYKAPPLIDIFFFCYHKSDVNCSPGSNSMIEKVLQIALTYLSPLLYEVAHVFSAHILIRNKRF